MFLGISGDLPTTSYVKMVEVWLLFTLMVPFISVLLHIYIDSLRVSVARDCVHKIMNISQVADERSINHHGVERPVGDQQTNVVKVKPAASKLISRNEKVEYEARKELYNGLEQSRKVLQKIDNLVFVGKVIVPTFIILFSSLYFWYGLSRMT